MNMVILQQFNVHVYLNLNWTFRVVLVFIWFDLLQKLTKVVEILVKILLLTV